MTATTARDQLLGIIVTDLMGFEGCEQQMYLDHRGLVTVGIGELLKTTAQARTVRFQSHRRNDMATADEITDEWIRVVAVGQNAMYPYSASHYRLDPPRIILPIAVACARAVERLQFEFIPGIVRHVPRFSFLPEAAQRALCDMAWTCGVGKGGLHDDFPKMIAAVNAGDFEAAARECHRVTIRKGDLRNKWTERMLRELP